MFFFALSVGLILNPFLVEMDDPSTDDWACVEAVQKICHSKDSMPLLKNLYPKKKGWFETLFPLKDFHNRTMQGARQVLIDRSQGLFPSTHLISINGGGQDCIVLRSTFNKNYPQMARSLIQALEEIGFQGVVYYREGGIPNPTGREVRYAAVPYAFKIFTLLEAYQKGYKNLLWLDTAVYPSKNPNYLFRMIEKDELLVDWVHRQKNGMLPKVQELLFEKAGLEKPHLMHARGGIFGIKMDAPWVDSFLKDFYEMAELGIPFLSCFPEESVLSALFYKYDKVHLEQKHKLLLAVAEHHTALPFAKKRGYPFFLRQH
jgi:hypothetical protein